MGDKKLSAHFWASEFFCRCGLPDCDAPPMRKEFIEHLEALRREYGKPLIVNSGARCAPYNSLLGGVLYSQHLLGNAADLDIEDHKDLQNIILLAEKLGFKGIGLGENFIHLDDRPHGTARWTY